MILVGGAIIGFAYLSKNFEGILEACQSINGMVGGPTIGFYTIGIFIPFVSELPAMIGLICGLSVSIWVFFGSNKFPAGPEERFQANIFQYSDNGGIEIHHSVLFTEKT